jgi:hypothetical protein
VLAVVGRIHERRGVVHHPAGDVEVVLQARVGKALRQPPDERDGLV